MPSANGRLIEYCHTSHIPIEVFASWPAQAFVLDDGEYRTLIEEKRVPTHKDIFLRHCETMEDARAYCKAHGGVVLDCQFNETGDTCASLNK